MEAAKEAKSAGMRYILEGSRLNATNKNVADALSQIMINVYTSHLYAEKEQYRGYIIYKEGGTFVATQKSH